MPDHNREVVVKPNQQLRAKHDRIVEIVAANPGISAAGIAKQYHGENLTSQHRALIVSVLTTLCCQRRIQHQSIDRYFIPEQAVPAPSKALKG